MEASLLVLSSVYFLFIKSCLKAAAGMLFLWAEKNLNIFIRDARFSDYAPHIWNKLAENCRSAPSLTSFNTKLPFNWSKAEITILKCTLTFIVSSLSLFTCFYSFSVILCPLKALWVALCLDCVIQINFGQILMLTITYWTMDVVVFVFFHSTLRSGETVSKSFSPVCFFDRTQLRLQNWWNDL